MVENYTAPSESFSQGQSTDRDDTGPRDPSYSKLDTESMDSTKSPPTYAINVTQLLQHNKHEGLRLPEVPLPPPDRIITFYNHPGFLVPLAMLHQELELDLAAWWWRKYPAPNAPGIGNVFSVDQLLTLLTHFIRQTGSNLDRDHAVDMLHSVVMRMLEGFETPTIYCSLQLDSSIYYGLCLIIHQHRNHLAVLSPHGNVGRLASFKPHQDGVTLKFRLLVGGSIKRRVSWPDACDPASSQIIWPPLFKRQATVYSQSLPAFIASELRMAGTSPDFGHTTVSLPSENTGARPQQEKDGTGSKDGASHSKPRAIRRAFVGRRGQNRGMEKKKTQADTSNAKTTPATTEPMTQNVTTAADGSMVDFTPT